MMLGTTNIKKKKSMIWYDMIHLLTAVGLKPGGSSTVHIYTQTIHRTAQQNGIPRNEQTWP